MTVNKLSQIATSPSNLAATDFLVGVTAGNVDYRFSPSQLQPTVSKIVLMADASYYIATTGSDSNPGTLANPWATLQHAMKFIASNIDIAGFNVTINIGAGTFVGVGIQYTAGGGNIMWAGAGSANTFIDNGVTDFVVNSGECVSFYFGMNTVVYFKRMTFKPSVDVFAIIDSFAPCICPFYDIVNHLDSDIVIDCTNLTSQADVVFWIDNPAAQFIDDIITYIGGNASITSVFLVEAGAEYIIGTNGRTSSVTGNLTVGFAGGGFATADNMGTISTVAVLAGPITGAGVTGPRYHIGFGGACGLEGQPLGSVGPNFFPGTTAGICDPGGTYDGFIGCVQAAGLPTTTQFPDTGTGGLYKDTSGGGVYMVYNDAGTIKKVALT